MRRFWLSSVLILNGVLSAEVKPVDFQREIRPILSDNCFQCHGPDEKHRMAKLRLDLKDDAARVLTPGKSDQSLLYQRISATETARRMPPEFSHKKLTQQQIATLKTWIDQGAQWKEHWAFVPPVMPPPPPVKNAAWSKNAIDRFILARLEKEGITPAPMADKRTLIRRVALDLTGLPPKPAEIEVFLADASPDAYEHMVDRYLASPHYGEHRARYWLDAARYGDTHGIHIDNYREIWPYRDWVINAYNRNMSFQQFATEQLAGDLLPNATLEQKIATGFHRCNVTTNEGGIIEDEYAEVYAKDRADTTGAVFFGLTVGCATCHDHKFDPISQKDFYSLGAFFRNTTQRVLDGNVSDTPPIVVVPREEDRAAWDRLTAAQALARADLEKARTANKGAFDQWLADRQPEKDAHPLDAADEVAKENLKVDSDLPFTVAVRFEFPDSGKNMTVVSQQDGKDRGNRGWAIDVTGRAPGFKLFGDNGRNIEVRASRYELLKPGSTVHLVAVYDGSRNQTGLDLYINGKPLNSHARGPASVELTGAINANEKVTAGKIGDVLFFKRALTEREAVAMHEWPKVQALLAAEPAELKPADRKLLFSYWLSHECGSYKAAQAKLDDLNKESLAISRLGSVSLVMEEKKDTTPFAYVLYRGAYDQKRDRVEANTPSVLPPMTPDLPRNRLGFAKWLFRDDQPLTARVTVNRMWSEIFGTGLVKTADDFGSQGEPPSHPQLLDWLAIDFRDHGWDMKRFYKQILMSATYRQAAITTPEKLAKDPENRLLSRGPRFRMDGEMVRDYALAASGLLAPQIGGPSARPYQPDGVWEAVAMKESDTRFYKRDSGDALYRRSMYTFWKRSAPPASMEIFNAPTRESCVVRRERTDTPLQALVAMNDVQFVEAARALAGRAVENVSSFDERLNYVSLRLLARPLTAEEQRIARKAYDDFDRFYSNHPDDARKLLSQGERKFDPGLPQADYAAMTMLTNEMLNLDEVLNK
jgi:hypothetical protein